VSDATTVTAPTLCIQTTSCDPSRALQTDRKLGCRSGDQLARSADRGLGVAAVSVTVRVGEAPELGRSRLQTRA
jgi:hypothetical protein